MATDRVQFTLTIGGGVPNGGTCRLHGHPCTIPWGYDRDHTDSPRPYTLGELEHREDPPHFGAYPDKDAYLLGWRIWRQIHRDSRLNAEESEVRMAGVEEWIRERMSA